MSNKYLILEFRNAGLFRKNRKTKDISFNDGERIKRTDIPEFVEPITAQQISNMLHVLFGERPVPMNRTVFYGQNKYLVEKAKESYLNITSLKDKNGKLIGEKIQLKKAVHNGWNPVAYVNWERVSRLLETDLFNEFIANMNEIFNIDCLSISFNAFKRMVLNSKDERIKNIFIELNKKAKKPLYDSIYGTDSELTNINKNNRTILTVFKGLDNIHRLNGEIFVPVSEDDIEKIRKNKGFAKLLDGGLVFITKVLTANQIEINDNHVLVGEISLEKQ
jgi:hypothetical protein